MTNIPHVELTAPDQDARLLEAARSGDERLVHSLLDWGLDVNDYDKNGHTALMFAAMAGHFDVVMALRKRGADTKMKDHLGYNACASAKYVGDLKGVLLPAHDKIVAYLEKFEEL